MKHRETPTAADKKNVIKNGKYFGLNKIHIGLLQCLNVQLKATDLVKHKIITDCKIVDKTSFDKKVYN